jgi:dipeptidyl aminopeptidase/acylaminoacyl peptidase
MSLCRSFILTLGLLLLSLSIGATALAQDEDATVTIFYNSETLEIIVSGDIAVRLEGLQLGTTTLFARNYDNLPFEEPLSSVCFSFIIPVQPPPQDSTPCANATNYFREEVAIPFWLGNDGRPIALEVSYGENRLTICSANTLCEFEFPAHSVPTPESNVESTATNAPILTEPIDYDFAYVIETPGQQNRRQIVIATLTISQSGVMISNPQIQNFTNIDEAQPDWSPDGRYLSFIAVGENSSTPTYDLFVYDTLSPTTNPRLITQDPPSERFNDLGAEWRNNEQLAFVRTMDLTPSVAGENPDVSNEIFLLNLVTLQETRLTSNEVYEGGLDWSPDGSRMAFVRNSGDAREIYVMRFDEAGNVLGEDRLTINSNLDAAPDWSPDGAVIAFISTTSGFREIWTMNPDGTNPQQMTNFAGNIDVFTPTWTPDGRFVIFFADIDPDPNTANFQFAFIPAEQYLQTAYQVIPLPDGAIPSNFPVEFRP